MHTRTRPPQQTDSISPLFPMLITIRISQRTRQLESAIGKEAQTIRAVTRELGQLRQQLIGRLVGSPASNSGSAQDKTPPLPSQQAATGEPAQTTTATKRKLDEEGISTDAGRDSAEQPAHEQGQTPPSSSNKRTRTSTEQPPTGPGPIDRLSPRPSGTVESVDFAAPLSPMRIAPTQGMPPIPHSTDYAQITQVSSPLPYLDITDLEGK